MIIKIYKNRDIKISTNIFDNEKNIKDKIAVKLKILPKFLYQIKDDEWLNLTIFTDIKDLKNISLLTGKSRSKEYEQGIDDELNNRERQSNNNDYLRGYLHAKNIKYNFFYTITKEVKKKLSNVDDSLVILTLKDLYRSANVDFQTILDDVKQEKDAIEFLVKNVEKQEQLMEDITNINTDELPEFSELIPIQQRRIIELNEVVENGDILYYFDKIILNENVIFASIKDFYKIGNTFTNKLNQIFDNISSGNKIKKNYKTSIDILKSWIKKTRDDCILIKYRVDNFKYKSAYIFIEDNLQIIYNNISDYNDQILSMWDIQDVKNTSIDYIKATFQIEDRNFNREILNYLIMNDKIMEKYMRIDDFQIPVKTTSNTTIYFYDNNIKFSQKSVICGLGLKSFKDYTDLINKGKLTLYINNIDDNINVNIRRSPGIKGIKQFMEIFKYLYAYYERMFDSVVNIYQNYDITIIQDDHIEEKSDELNLLKRLPEIFTSGYKTNCPPEKRPVILPIQNVEKYREEYNQLLSQITKKSDWSQKKKKEKKDIKLKLLKILKFPASEQDEEDMIEGKFPDNKPFEITIHGRKIKSNWYACNRLNSDNIIPSDKYAYPRLTTNSGKNKKQLPLVPCCISKLSGKKRKKKKITQSSELMGNQIASKGRKGFLPKELKILFFYLNPEYQYHRYGVKESINSIIDVLNKALKVKKTRKSLLKCNFDLSKQENYDLSNEQIKEDIESDTYLDPKRYIRLLEKLYNCQLYIFSLSRAVTRHDKKKQMPILSIPYHKYGTNYYRYNTRKNVVIVFEHFGNDESRKYPHCELIFRTDYDNYNTKYHFKIKEKISINLKRLFNLYNLSYSLGVQIISQPLISFENVKFQILDYYGKCRGIILKNNMTMLFDPIAPLNYTSKSDFPIPKYDDLFKFLKDSIYKIKKLNRVNAQIIGINCQFNNIDIFFPCESHKSDIKYNSQIIYFREGNHLNEFIIKKKNC